MIRGTNAQFKFNLPYNYSKLSVVKVTFWQLGNTGENIVLATKTLASCTKGANDNELFVSLDPQETLRFSDEKKAYVQLRAKVEDGNAFASKQTQITVYPVCDDSILGDDDIMLPSPTEDEWVYLDGGLIV